MNMVTGNTGGSGILGGQDWGQPKVSVIVPTSNRPDMLPRALSSIAEQTYRNLQIVVVNDGGPDVSTIIEKLKTGIDIVHLRHENNLGVAAARNTGLQAAVGKYIAYLDDDDLYYADHIETLVTFLENSEYRIAYTDAYRAHQTYQDCAYRVIKRDLPYSRDFDFDRLLCGNYIPTLCVMHEKSCIETVGLFDDQLSRVEDWDLWVRMALRYPIFHLKKTTCEFSWRKDGSSMTSGRIAEFRKCYEAVCDRYRHFVEGKPVLQQIRKDRTAEFYFSEANQYLRQGRHDHARQVAAAYLQRYGDHPKLNQLLQQIDSDSGENTRLADTGASFSGSGHAPLAGADDGAGVRFNVKQSPRSALICVTYGENWPKLSRTLDSIYRNTQRPFHLFLVDNASTGRTLDLYKRTDLPNTTLIRNPENVWWGGGINQGLRLAIADDFEYFFFLNDDIEVPTGWLARLTGILAASPDVGAVGPLNSSVRDWQGYDNVRQRHKATGLPPAHEKDRLDLEGMNALLQQHPQRWCYIDGMLAFFCTGFKRPAVQSAGYLDPDFFELMCGDDNAYCMEIRKAGFKLALALDTYVLHHSGYSVSAYGEETRRAQKQKAALLLKQKYPEYYGPMVARALNPGDEFSPED